MCSSLDGFERTSQHIQRSIFLRHDISRLGGRHPLPDRYDMEHGKIVWETLNMVERSSQTSPRVKIVPNAVVLDVCF